MSNLKKRIIYGAIYVLLMLIGTLIHPVVFAIIFGAILFFTQFEFYAMLNEAGHKPSKWVGTISGLIFFLICHGIAIDLLPKEFILSSILIILFLLIYELFRCAENTIGNSGVSVLGFLYIAMPISLLNFIVHAPINGQSNTFYPWVLVGILLIIWANDSFAYLIGSSLGKHKLYKTVSPAKSWEGAIGGGVFAIIIGIINAVLFQEISMTNWIVISILTVVFGTLGDLFESKIKREIGAKDSGSILPGHGGYLDRLDSLLFAIPVVFMWLLFSGTI